MKKWIGFVGAGLLLFAVPFLLQDDDKKEIVDKEAAACEVLITVEGVDEPLALEEYVKGVIAAEMPIRFEMEALKAQAIAARTYAVKSTNYGASKIEASTRRQVFKSADERAISWKDEATAYEKKLKQAVEETAGEVLVYDNELITAMFHASSNGQTESSENYGGSDVPYLKSVDSPEKLVQVQSFKLAELNRLLGVNWKAADWQAIGQRLERNNSGRVSTVSYGNFKWTGREFRTLLGLRSTAFEVTVDSDSGTVHFTVAGYGHGVGMSQEGANVLAQDGLPAEEILLHYYEGVAVEQLECAN